MLYMSISLKTDEAVDDGISFGLSGYSISAWGIVIAILWLAMILFYFQVRKKFRSRFPGPRKTKS